VIGAVVLALLTLLVVVRRRIVDWVRARYRASAEVSRLRRRIRPSCAPPIRPPR